ncbi:hypothetical protein FCIRC_11068 [Fusarium circinatum]|uniref:Uncharacterized protein n=1 Tax=Fusarium circinatum TaxID=48490 RepID=A0A8H5T757_FUSCI|nr:hypothetical protein FCIRC_11068 [Fusarium circinatum]
MELQFTDPNLKADVYNNAHYSAESCGLCRFYFSEGDEIISCKDRERVPKLRRGTYRFLGRYLVPYHLECFEIVGRQSYHSVAAATWPGIEYEGPHHLAGRRRLWLENTFAQNLFRTLRGRLPHDVCQQIAVYFPREHAMQAFQQLWSKDRPRQPRNISVPVHCGVTLWAQYVHYEGNRYIESFSHDSRGGDEEVVLKWEPKAKEVPNIFIRHSGLGASKIIVTEDSEAPDVEHVEGFDGIKIRRLSIVKSPDSLVEFQIGGPCEIRWAVPAAPVKHSPKIPLSTHFESQFVRAFDWNKPGTAGTPAAPEEYDRFAYDGERYRRLYLAMSPGESVSELWLRSGRNNRALVVVTNFGHSLVVGTDLVHPHMKYHVIARLPENKPCRMFYAETIECHIAWLHFDSVSTWRHPEERQIQPTQETCVHWSYRTSARLRDVREVTPCSKLCWGSSPDRLGTPKAATSDTMFLQYQSRSGGFPESDGYLLESGLDWFGFSEPPSGASSNEGSDNADGESHEMKDNSQSGDDSGEESDSDEPVISTTTIAVPMRGRIDWILRDSDEIYALSYHKNSSPKDTMHHVLAEDATMPRQESVTKSLTVLVGIIAPLFLTQAYETAESTGNYDIFGL